MLISSDAASRSDRKQTPFRLQPTPYIIPRCLGEYELLHEEPHFVVVNKPDGLLTVPGRNPLNHDSLYSRLEKKYGTVWVVHRLDMDTSGLLIVARTREGASVFGKLFQNRLIEKQYVAVVDGLVEQDQGHIYAPLIADWPNRPLQKVCEETGKASHTEFQVLSRDTERKQSRMLLIPHTGRSHQLRIHMRELGHPIVGCDMYSPDEVCYAADRLLLHAQKLSFDNPFSEGVIVCESPPVF